MSRSSGFVARVVKSPVAVGVITMAAAGVFAWLRLVRYAHHNPGAFALVGAKLTDPAHLPRGIPILTPIGYDGQFYYRFALAPYRLGTTFAGITLDTPFRRARIGYSFISWITAGGQTGAVPWTLIIVNVVGLGVLGWLCGLWAKDLGSPALAGLLPAGFFGFVFTLARDLTEITAGVLLVAGLVLLRRQRPVWAGVALSAAVLSKETAMLLVAAVALSRLPELVGLRRPRVRPGRQDLAWFLPVVAFVLWEVVCTAVYGPVPILADKANTGVPFVALFRILRIWLAHPSSYHLDLAQVGVLSVVVIVALVVGFRSRASWTERIAFVLALAIAASLSGQVWDSDPNEIRTVSELWILASGLVISARDRWARWAVPLLVAATGSVWVAAATTKVSIP